MSKLDNKIARLQTKRARVDHSSVAWVPIRDTFAPDCPIIFVLTFFGITAWQMMLIPEGEPGGIDPMAPHPYIGSGPIVRALRRRGFDTDRYQAFIWDIGGTMHEK